MIDAFSLNEFFYILYHRRSRLSRMPASYSGCPEFRYHQGDWLRRLRILVVFIRTTPAEFFLFFYICYLFLWPVPIRINPEVWVFTDSLKDCLDWWSAVSQGPYIHRKTRTQKKHGQASMPLVEFEPTATVFELAKEFHCLDRAATVIGLSRIIGRKLNRNPFE